MKAIILTFAPVSESDTELLINTKILKLAINGHAEKLKPDLRICTDYGIVGDLLQKFTQKIITTRDYAPNERLIYAGQLFFKGSTMVSAVEYLIKTGNKKILIVGDNTVHQEFFKERINNEINLILKENPEIEIFQYINGNFRLPVKSVEQFIKE